MPKPEEQTQTIWKVKPEYVTVKVNLVPEFYDWKDVYEIDGHLIYKDLLETLYTKVK